MKLYIFTLLTLLLSACKTQTTAKLIQEVFDKVAIDLKDDKTPFLNNEFTEDFKVKLIKEGEVIAEASKKDINSKNINVSYSTLEKITVEDIRQKNNNSFEVKVTYHFKDQPSDILWFTLKKVEDKFKIIENKTYSK